MAKAKIIKQGIVHVFDENGLLHSFGPGDEVPDWANITNPALFAGDDDEGDERDGESAESAAGGEASAPAEKPAKVTIESLRNEAKTLGLSTAGKKADLEAR